MLNSQKNNQGAVYMKKLLALLLCMVMTLSLSACSGDFWYPLNLLFENKATVEQAEPSEDAGDVEEEDAKETADKPDEREEDATEVEKEEQEKKKEESKKETSNKQVSNRERTGKYKVSYSTTEEDYHSFDIEHLDLVDDLEDDLEMLKTKKDTKEYIRTHICYRVFIPNGGFFGTKISYITKSRCPKIYNYLVIKLDELQLYINTYNPKLWD